MTSNIYRIRFKKSSYELESDYDNLSENDQERILELRATGTFDYNFNKEYNTIVITTPVEITRYQNVLNQNLIEFNCEDISNKILMNQIDLEDELSFNLNTSNSIKYSFFIDDLNNWIYENLDIDIILDRILESGIKSLKEIELKYLNNYNKKQ
jgi:hypothetical protein